MERVAQQIPDPRVEDLVRAGRVRVALLEGVAPGIRMDLARAFAARLGIEVLPIEYPTPTAAVESLKTGACDVGFLVIDPARAAVVDSRLHFWKGPLPISCPPAPKSAASRTQTSPEFVSRWCALMPQSSL